MGGSIRKFSKFATRWAQKFWKLMEKCLMKLNSKLATLKIQTAGIEPIWANPEILLFLRMRVFNFFFNFMPQKYQNEKSPILNCQKKPKTSGKVRTAFRPFENTRYMIYHLWFFRYIDNMRCLVTYKLGTSCSKMRFSCNNVDLPNKDRKCKKGDALRVGRKM